MIIRFALLFTVVQCCTIFGSEPDLNSYSNLGMSRYDLTLSQSILLFMALKYAVEKEGFDTILNKVTSNSYERVVKPGMYMHRIPYAFLWQERIDPEDESPTAQFLFAKLREEGDFYNVNGVTVQCIYEGMTFFSSNGTLFSRSHDHSKNEILTILEELKPMSTKIINAILTNSNVDPL